MSALTRSARMASSSSRSLTAAGRISTIARHLSSTPAMSAESSTQSPVAELSIEYRTEGLARIYKLNRTKALNALNHEMITSLTKKVHSWRDSELCQVIIGTGSERAFCSGGDVKQLILDLKDGKQTALPFFKEEFELNWLLAKTGKAYVSVMDGVTMGGGNGIALPAQIRIATPRTRFAMPETKIGYAPDVGVNYYLAQLDGSIGAWLALTGQEVFGRAAYELGLATHYVTPESIPHVVHEISQLSNPSEQHISEIVSSFSPPPPSRSELSSKKNPDGHTAITGDIRKHLDWAFSRKSVSEIYESLKKTETDEKASEAVKAWAQEQRTIMDARSPTGMAVALEGYRRARHSKRLDDVLHNDIAMATGFSGPKRATDDFITGVTAVLVSKSADRPSWSPSSISDEAISPANITTNFFDSRSDVQSARPQLIFNPPSRSKSGKDKSDSTWGLFRKYGLPSEAAVEAIVSGSAPGSGAFKVTQEELVQRLVDERGDAAGPRAEEVGEWIRAIVQRKCKVGQDGYLDMKRT